MSSQQLVYTPNVITPSVGLVGPAPLIVSSVYSLSPFGVASDARRGKRAWGPLHMLVSSYTSSPLEMVVLELKCAHRVSWYACSLKALDSSRQVPFEAGCFCVLLHPLKTGDTTSDSQNRTTQRVVPWRVVLNWSLPSSAASLSLVGCKLQVLAGYTRDSSCVRNTW